MPWTWNLWKKNKDKNRIFFRRFIFSTFFLGLLLNFSVSDAVFSEETTSKKAEIDKEKPNVILIMTDDQGYSDLGCFNAEGFVTPHIDQLAKEGRRFTQFYSGATVCSPSRAALLTGCYPQRVGIDDFVFFPTRGKNSGPGLTGLHPNEYTMGEMFKDAGYQTACIGKWHLGDADVFLPNKQGFDFYFGLPYSNDMVNGKSLPKKEIRTNFPPLPLYENEQVLETDPDQRFLTHRYTEKAVAFIKKNQKQPFFLYFPHSMPHVPLHPHPDFVGKSANGIYGDVIQEIDWSVGQIMQTLQECGLEKKTVIIFTSDNGPWLTMGKHGGSAAPLRDGKQTKYDGGHRVPCIIWYPNEIQGGTVGSEIISSIDLLPSLTKIVGGHLPVGRVIDGLDAWDYFSGKTQQSPRDTYFYNRRVVRNDEWKLFLPGRYSELNSEKQQNITVNYDHVRLYNLKNDIAESQDVHNKHPEIVENMKQLLKQYEKDLKINTRPLGKTTELKQENK